MAVDLINMLYSVTGHKFKFKGRPLCDTTRKGVVQIYRIRATDSNKKG